MVAECMPRILLRMGYSGRESKRMGILCYSSKQRVSLIDGCCSTPRITPITVRDVTEPSVAVTRATMNAVLLSLTLLTHLPG